jgi:hypothetical protein
VWAYHILVPDGRVPLWKERSSKGIAKLLHLYTQVVSGIESDEIERWFEREYETPAEEVLQKVTSDGRLTPDDWVILVRFLALQDVRTPARLVENLQRWRKTLPDWFEDTLQKCVDRLEDITSRGEKLSPTNESPLTQCFPLRVTTQTNPGQDFGTIKAESAIGRGLWLFSIKSLLTTTASALHRHRWTILHAPEGVNWFTSDDPVIRLNYQDSKNYNFGGGWGSMGTVIFMPLSPRHIFYTQVGKRPPGRGTRFSLDEARMIRRFTAEHAHRIIFATEPDGDVPKLRPRVISADIFKDERIQWSKWHEEQTAMEKKLMGRKESENVQI